MPHFIIEYSANVGERHDIAELVNAVHEAVLGLDLATPAAVRVRAVERVHYKVADQDDPNHGFVAMVARIGPGRADEVKHNIIETVLNAAEQWFDNAAMYFNTEGAGSDPVIPPSMLIAWSMEVQEIDAEFRQNRNHIKGSY